MKLGMAALLLSLATACGGTKVEKDLEPTKQDSGPPSYSFNSGFPFILEFKQGLESSYNLLKDVQVPGGNPVLTIENLPEGVAFDGTTLTWTPSCDLPIETFGNGYTLYHILFTLKREGDDKQYVTRAAVLWVIQHPLSSNLKCGEKPTTSMGSPK